MSNRTYLAVAISTGVLAFGCSSGSHSLTGDTGGASGATAQGGTGGRDAGAGGTGGASGFAGTNGGCPVLAEPSPPPCPGGGVVGEGNPNFDGPCIPGMECVFTWRFDYDYCPAGVINLVCCDNGLVFLGSVADCSAVTATLVGGGDPRCSAAPISGATSCSDEGLVCSLDLGFADAGVGGETVVCCNGNWIRAPYGNKCPPVDGGGTPADAAID
jgi:hypothetical protein